MKQEDFMREAVKLSLENIRKKSGGPFGAVIVKDQHIIGRGENRVTATFDPTAHAEIVAIRDACQTLGSFSLQGCEIYSSCEPCPMCLSAIYWARLDKVYFANTQEDAANIDFDDAYLYKQIALDRHARALPSAELLRDEAFAVFKEWEDMEDKIHY